MQYFVDAVALHRQDMIKKQQQKVHLMLHYVNCMEQYGPTSSFNSERYYGLKNIVMCNYICS